MLPSVDVTEKYKPLSLRLYQALEDIGATTEIRDHLKDTATSIEILFTIALFPNRSVYLFGSRYEGTLISDMGSDTDNVNISHEFQVVQGISQSQLHRDVTYLRLVPVKEAGYAKLEVLKSSTLPRSPFTLDIDRENRFCLIQKKNSSTIRDNPGCNRVWHGPAMQNPGSLRMEPADNIFGLRCHDWPKAAAEWLTRSRRYDWPSPNLIAQCKTLGFVLVSAGHPNSSENHFQWRMSLSHQERLLVTHFNSVQLKCYILMKLINKEILRRKLKTEALTSYHSKTCMFYLIENTPADFWTKENLISCLIAGLRMIKKWLKHDNCPNYFIPEENMFDRIETKELKAKLGQELERILQFDLVTDLENLQTNGLGRHLKELEAEMKITVTGPVAAKATDSTKVQEIKLSSYTDYFESLFDARNHILKKCYDTNTEKFYLKLRSRLAWLEQLETVTEHSKEEVQTAIMPCLPFFRQILYSHVIAMSVRQNESSLREMLPKLLISDKWQDLDLDSSVLKQATIMCQCGYYTDSLNLLIPMKYYNRFSICYCDFWKRTIFPQPKALLEVIHTKQEITARTLLRDVLTPCVVFLPSEHVITPCPISYEMIRSFGMPPESRNNVDHFWYDWAVVDGRFLLHFLLFLNHRKLGDHFNAAKAIEKMCEIVTARKTHPDTLSHQETCLNIIGWIYIQCGYIDWAWLWYKSSLRLQPTHNAVLWHLCFLVCHLLKLINMKAI